MSPIWTREYSMVSSSNFFHMLSSKICQTIPLPPQGELNLFSPSLQTYNKSIPMALSRQKPSFS